MKKAIIGYGGHAREVQVQMNQPLTFFVEDMYVTGVALPLSQFNPLEYQVLVAISDTQIRKRIVDSLPTATSFFTFVHPTALIMDSTITIGDGSFVGAYSVLTTNIKVGKHSMLSRACHIGHDVVTGDYLSMMPNSVISGNCKIGHNVYIGTNSSIRENTYIADQVTLGLNTGVIKDILETGVYGGTPCKKLKPPLIQPI